MPQKPGKIAAAKDAFKTARATQQEINEKIAAGGTLGMGQLRKDKKKADDEAYDAGQAYRASRKKVIP